MLSRRMACSSGSQKLSGRQRHGVRDRLDPVLAWALFQHQIVSYDAGLLGQFHRAQSLAVSR